MIIHLRKSSLLPAFWRQSFLLGLLIPLSLSAAPASQPATAGFQPNATLAVIPERTWQKVAGFAPTSGGALAYSGATFDSVNQQFLLFGGGHGDYWGNEVCAFSPQTLTWKKMYEPDAQARYTNDNIDNANGKLKDSDKPYTRHTYNQLCFVTSSASMFIFGGCGPGWGDIRPTCWQPHDTWSYSWKDNQWTQLAKTGAPGGVGKACCYDCKRDTVWGFNGEDGDLLCQFDLKTKAWSRHPVKPPICKFGVYNLQMLYLPKSDRVMIISNEALTVNPDSFETQRFHLDKACGKGGLAYLPDQDAALYVSLPGENPSPDVRVEAFDCATGQWLKQEVNGLVARGDVWARLQYDPVNKVALLVAGNGVWAYKPPPKFTPQ